MTSRSRRRQTRSYDLNAYWPPQILLGRSYNTAAPSSPRGESPTGLRSRLRSVSNVNSTWPCLLTLVGLDDSCHCWGCTYRAKSLRTLCWRRRHTKVPQREVTPNLQTTVASGLSQSPHPLEEEQPQTTLPFPRRPLKPLVIAQAAVFFRLCSFRFRPRQTRIVQR